MTDKKSVGFKNKRTEDEEIFIHDVLIHYRKSGRHDLPWRKNINAYRVLVSEIMLQQTQVSRVLQKYETWMKYYPSISSLAKSSLRNVLLLWQGLGYQRRAKALLAIAQQEKQIPKTFDGLMRLPGIGTYTASAVSAFAYNQFTHPVLETNIRTALIEYFHQGEQQVHDRVLYDDLTRLELHHEVISVGARVWYYALMDFGAYLKCKRISHNTKSVHYIKQSPYKGSFRELRAKVLFAITRREELPVDDRCTLALEVLIREGYIKKQKRNYVLV